MNQDFLIIDTHVHTYPNIETGRQSLGSKGYGYYGTINELMEVMRNLNISYSVMANFLPLQEMKKASITRIPADLNSRERELSIQEIDQKMIERMKRKNRWTCEEANKNPKLIPLVSVDVIQSVDKMVKELDSMIKMGARGMKLHPIANEYYPWDERMSLVYSKAQEAGIPILFHSGVGELPGWDSKYGSPSGFAKVAKAFPSLIIILAHLGRGFYEESVEAARKCSNIYFDTSTCLNPETVGEISELIRKIGVQRVLFGTDWPWRDPKKDIEIIKSMNLTDEEKKRIFGLNAKEIYKI